ncbi:MAG: pitrilysin family protein [bacterium]|nr:pitrilysin family protein [bacterium]
MILDRNIAPAFHAVKSLNFPDYHTYEVRDGLLLYGLNAGTQEVIRLDLIFNAGLIKQISLAQSAFTASMLSEGTSHKSAKDLAEALDYYGSYFQTRNNADDAVATLYCLEKHLSKCLPLFIEALTDSIFPEKELQIQKKNSIQKLMVNEKKNSYLCKKSYYANMYGKEHPYSSFSTKESIEAVNRESLQSFYSSNYILGLKYLMISGKYKDEIINQIIEEMRSTPFQLDSSENLDIQGKSNQGKHFIEKNDSVQSAIRIGKQSISRSHPEFRKLQFLNLIFGGYFGSRLMKNIREDKGLTYGIYSVIEPNLIGSSWYIDSDINTKNRSLGLEEIYKEMAKIREELIPEAEIETARNYYLGSFLRSLDGPFSLADRLKILIDYKLPNTYYPEFVEILNSLGAKELQELAQKYFSEQNIVEVIVGKK